MGADAYGRVLLCSRIVESKVKDAIKAKLDLDKAIERAHRVERRKKKGSATQMSHAQ